MSELSRISRVDAVRNRGSLVAAARVLIAEVGVTVPLSVVASRAGLAPATLYRHFPSRADLLAAVYLAETERCRELLREARKSEDAFEGLLQALVAFADLEVRSPGFTVTLVEPAPGTTLASPAAARAMADLSDLVARARLQPHIRDDLTLDDVVVTIASIRTAAALDPVKARARCTRIVTLFERAIIIGIPHQSRKGNEEAGSSSLAAPCEVHKIG